VNQKRASRKKWLIRGIKLLIAAAIVWWVSDSLAAGWTEVNQRDQGQWDWQPGWLAVAGGLYLIGLLPCGLFWHHVLGVLGQEARLGRTLGAYYIGHLGKYVPGKAMVVVLRVGLVRGHGVDTAVAAVSVFVETLTMMAVGAFAAAAYLAVFYQGAWWSCGAAILMAVSLLPTLPPVFKRLVRLAGVGKSDPNTAQNLEKLGYRTLLIGWVLMALGWVIMGLSYWATLRAFGIAGLDPVQHLPFYTAGVSLAVVAGFLLLILPGGVGVREAFLAELACDYLRRLPGATHPNSTAWASAFLLRLVWLVSELAISGILYPIVARTSDTQGPADRTDQRESPIQESEG